MAGVRLIIEAANETYAFDLPISDDMMRELSQSIEFGDDHLSLTLTRVIRKDSYIKYRRKVLKMRSYMVEEVMSGVRKALEDHFSRNDTVNGYKENK